MRTISRPRRIGGYLLAVILPLLATACEPEAAARNITPEHPPKIVLGRPDSLASDLGPFVVTDMNERGDIVGYSKHAWAYRWTRAGGLEHLTGDGGRALVSDINAAGTAAGGVMLDGRWFLPDRAAVWEPGGRVRLLPQPEGWSKSRAEAINDSGMVAGVVHVNDQVRIFVWSEAAGMRLLPPVGPAGNYVYHQASGINARGDVLGSWQTERKSGAFIFKASGQVVRLFDNADDVKNFVTEITDAGTVVGCSDRRPAVWDSTGTRRLLGPSGCALSINSSGVVVGFLEPAPDTQVAFRWTPAGGLEELGALGGRQGIAADVNEAGDVTGWAETASGERRAFLWTADGGMQALDTPGVSEGRFINGAREVAGQSTRDTTSYATRWFGAETRPRVAQIP